MKKVIILIGNYGSGKTEIALNMAFLAAAEGKRVQVIDLDRINDYFRMSDHVKLLEESNIALISPTFVGAGITQTNMPAAVGSAFAQRPGRRPVSGAVSHGLRRPGTRTAGGL